MIRTFIPIFILIMSLVPAWAMAEGQALVIGNGAYPDAPLENPVNDATDVAAALGRAGYEVDVLTNADARGMERAIRDFGKRLSRGGPGIFFYAGHGLQVHGRNYLVPVDAVLESQSDVRFECVDAGRVTGSMEDAGAEPRVIILDACRDNPFDRSHRSTARGLAVMDGPAGSIIAYSTAPGSVASDGQGRNSVYTRHLLAAMARPGITVERAFKAVRRQVMAETGGRQVPWESSSLTADVFFQPRASTRAIGVRPKNGAARPQKAQPASAAKEPATPPFPAPETGDVEWREISDPLEVAARGYLQVIGVSAPGQNKAMATTAARYMAAARMLEIMEDLPLQRSSVVRSGKMDGDTLRIQFGGKVSRAGTCGERFDPGTGTAEYCLRRYLRGQGTALEAVPEAMSGE